jgi:hypothetical protein
VLKVLHRSAIALALVLAVWLETPAAQDLALPNKPDSVKFLVFGDQGSGDKQQYEIGTQMAIFHKKFAFPFAITVGDNMYGAERPQDFKTKFELPYKGLLDEKVEFYASLGNHDDPNQRLYKPYGMGGKNYYTFKKGNVRFFALDSNYMDPVQVAWFENELKNSGADWKIPYFHHPLYSSGMHGSQLDLRAILEPLFIKYSVDVVFSGHEHFYQRIKPQKGIYYFVTGAAGKLRRGDLKPAEFTEYGNDKEYSFMLIEVADKELYFQCVDRLGKTMDKGMITRKDADKK